ncbi:MAG TPA: hypothetical protein VNQ79_14400 [Blastocatellia bacterium]|nr:hypothetical protein [Blastocatellia bacterium]
MSTEVFLPTTPHSPLPTPPDRRFNHWLQRRIKQALHEAVGRIVTAGRFALVAARPFEIELARFGIDDRMKFKQGFVHAAELFGAQVFVIHRAPSVPVADKGQRANRVEQIVVCNLASVEIGDGVVREEKAAECGQTQFRAAAITELPHHQPEAVKEIAVARAESPFGQSPQTRDGIEPRVSLARFIFSRRSKEQFAVFGHEEKEQPVHEPQQLAVIILLVEFALAQTPEQHLIGRVREEAASERFDRLFDAAAQGFERARALFLGGLRPLLQPARFDSFAFAHLNARLVAEEPQQREVGVQLAVHHRFEVEFDIGLPRQADVVAQDAQLQSVRDEAPQVRFRTVEQFLHHSVRRDAGRSRYACRAFVKLHFRADQMNRRLLPGVRDGIASAINLDGFRGLQPAIPEFTEERQQPLFARQCGAGISRGQRRERFLKNCPRAEQPVPGLVDRFVKSDIADEVVILRRQSFELRIAISS